MMLPPECLDGPGAQRAQGRAVPPVVDVLLGTPGDTASRQVVRGHLYGDFIPGQDADEVHAQLARDVGQDDVTIADVHMECGVGQRLGDDALQLDHIVFCQV